MTEIIIEDEAPPSAVSSDFRDLRTTVSVDLLRVEAGPDDGWTIHVMDDTNREEFERVTGLVEDVVTGSDDIRRFYDYSGDPRWLVQVRY